MSLLPDNSGNSLFDLLKHYTTVSDTENWLAATVLTKHQSSYRKPGAMLLVSPRGKVHGLVSGSCLENDVVLRAQKVQAFNRPEFVIYDSTDEDNIAAELGLGCKGRVGILIQELTPSHQVVLRELYARQQAGQTSHMLYCCESPDIQDLTLQVLLDEQLQLISSTHSSAIDLPPLPEAVTKPSTVFEIHNRLWVLLRYLPPITAWVIGGGADAKPLVTIAAMLGWRVSIIDHRANRGQTQYFPAAEQIIRSTPEDFFPKQKAQAVFLMTHNQSLDARWLRRLSQLDVTGYLGLLGPVARKNEVLAEAGIKPTSSFAQMISGPMGFNIGGDLPESVAISAIAECHQLLSQQGHL